MRALELLIAVLAGIAAAQGHPVAPAAAHAASAHGAAATVATHPAFGTHLVDQDGRTLYLFASDRDDPGRCGRPCLDRWPPLLTDGAAAAGAGVDASLLDVVDRGEVGQQLAYAGWPLYRFAGDTGPGDAAGHGLGGVWFVVAPDGTAVPVSASSPAPASPAAPGGPRGRFEAFTLQGPHLTRPREVVVYLPPGYDEGDRRYPVAYLTDGQNVFDRRPFAGRWLPVADDRSWLAHEAADRLAEAGRPVIVVAVTSDAGRAVDYLPFEVAANGYVSRADGYAAFLVDTLKSRVDAAYRTRPEPATTAIVGASFGGIISLYAGLSYPRTFGFAAALSATWGVADHGMEAWIAENPAPSVRVYLDYGTYEGAPADLVGATLSRLATTFDALGNEVSTVIATGGAHDEAAWSARLPDVLERFVAGVDRARAVPGGRAPPTLGDAAPRRRRRSPDRRAPRRRPRSRPSGLDHVV
jgi:predicted alpha/beta superfamily hydrolase/predicted lipoprotein with Yx(FWY)xxD motif